MGQRHDRGSVVVETHADAVCEAGAAEQAADRQTADRHDELRAEKTKLPLAPERAKFLLLRRGRSVTFACLRAPGIAAGHGRAVERRVELALVHLKPAAECSSCLAAPRPPLLALDDPRRLAEHVSALALVGLDDR